MKFKGTKDWKLRLFEVDEDRSIPEFFIDGGKCESTVSSCKFNSSVMTREEFDANAHLIAASPELLEALQSILLNGHSDKSVLKAEQAINKALNK